MLSVFRKYQKGIYLIVTFVIVISFTFFGTQGALTQPTRPQKTVFVDLNGHSVSQEELDSLLLFLRRDEQDLLLHGGQWGFNGLNDGVILKDFLENGVAHKLAMHFMDDLKSDFQLQLKKEKKYQPYVHPTEKFISAESAWNYFAPNFKQVYHKLQKHEEVSLEWFDDRIALYLEQMKFSPFSLARVLYFQQQQYEWIQADPELQYRDFFLFGHHTVDEWFKLPFIELMGQFIWNAAILSEKQGYQVSADEALVDLMSNHERSYHRYKGQTQLGAISMQHAWKSQLNRLGFNEGRAVEVWKKILLFRKLIHDVPSLVVLDALPFRQFQEFATETAEVKLYKLPQTMQIKNFQDLQQWELYTEAVYQPKQSLLDVPTEQKIQSEIEKSFPELIQQEYRVKVTSVSQSQITEDIPIRELWDWQVQDDSWEAIKTKFTELAKEKAETEDQRFHLLDNLLPRVRQQVDRFSRIEMLQQHPEWLEAAFNKATMQEKTLKVTLQGGKDPLEGIKDHQEFMKTLDQAFREPVLFSGNQQHHHKLLTIEKKESKELLSFEEAKASGVLKEKVKMRLEEFYLKERTKYPQEFMEDKGWKSFSKVRQKVTELYYKELIDAISEDAKAHNVEIKQIADVQGELCAPYRFFSWMRQQYQETIQEKEGSLLITQDETSRRSAGDEETPGVFGMIEGDWSAVIPSSSGTHRFFRVIARNPGEGTINPLIQTAQKKMSQDVQQAIIQDLLAKMVKGKAIAVQVKAKENGL